MNDVQSNTFNAQPVRRLFLALGHGVLTPVVDRRETKSGYLESAAQPAPMPAMPGVLITAGQRGNSVDLTHFIGERAVSLPHEILMYLQRLPQSQSTTVQAIKNMLRHFKNDGGGRLFPNETRFTVRTPGSELASAVMWAPGERTIYGGVWMIDLANPTEITNAAGMFGLVERPVDELECRRQVSLDAQKQKAVQLASTAYGYTSGSTERMKTDLSLDGVCRGELKYADDDDQLITMRDFLSHGQRHLRADDIMVVVMCRNYASYAADYMHGMHSPRNSTTEKKIADFGGGLKKCKGRSKHKKTKKSKKKYKTRSLKGKQ